MGKQRRPRSSSYGKETEMKLEDITPDVARDYLDKNTNNRPCPKRTVTRLVLALVNGEWEVNGETIKFDRNGTLIDGQTRLMAVIESGVTIRTWVLRGLEPNSFDTIDQGRSRSIAHVLARNGHKYYQELAIAANLVFRMGDGMPDCPGGLRVSVAIELLKAHPEIAKSVALMHDLNIKSVSPAGSAAGFHYLMSRKDPDLAGQFWESIANGLSGKTNPIRLLRDAMMQNRGVKRSLSQRYIHAITIKAWNLRRAGKTCCWLRWNPETQEFPVIE